jgi:hypothetical protein
LRAPLVREAVADADGVFFESQHAWRTENGLVAFRASWKKRVGLATAWPACGGTR